MDFEIDHQVSADPERVAEILLDERFQDSLSDLDGLSERTVVAQEKNGDIVERRVRYVLDVRVSGIARSFLGDAEPAWVEIALWDPAAFRWDWTIEPEVAPELLEAAGTTELVDHSTGTARLVRGSVKVKVPIYGGKVEGWIVDGLERAYEEEARRIEKWLSA